ncbi:MAG TPA: hypothetical protein VGH27_04415 [Streptosporangiaceae bacterium]
MASGAVTIRGPPRTAAATDDEAGPARCGLAGPGCWYSGGCSDQGSWTREICRSQSEAWKGGSDARASPT